MKIYHLFLAVFLCFKVVEGHGHGHHGHDHHGHAHTKHDHSQVEHQHTDHGETYSHRHEGGDQPHEHDHDHKTTKSTSNGTDHHEKEAIAMSTEDQHNSNSSYSWLYAILGALAVSSTSLTGLLFLWINKKFLCKLVDHVTSFAVGTLLATVVFHVYPEASEYLFEHKVKWIVQGLFIAGIITALAFEQLLHLIVHAFGGVHLHGNDLQTAEVCAPPCEENQQSQHHHHHHHDHDHHHHADIEAAPHTPNATYHNHDHEHASTGTCIVSADSDVSKKEDGFFSKHTVASIKPVAWVVALGDFFHSFIDGILIAISFLSCNQEVGWLVTFAVVLHEIPHRIGDFFVFLKAGLSTTSAIYLNLAASLSSVIGVILLLSVRDVDFYTLGYMLSFASGMLMFIALSELLPSVMHTLSRKGLLINLICMITGVVIIKLALAEHTHCHPGGGAHDHDHGHDHHH